MEEDPVMVENKPINSIQAKIYTIVKKYYDIQVFQVIKEIFLPIDCIVYLDQETAADKYQELSKDLESIGILCRLTRVSRAEIPKIPKLAKLDPAKIPCHIKFDTTYLRKTGSVLAIERKKNLIKSGTSILITSGTIALSTWFYFTKMDPVFAYANNSHINNVLNSIFFGLCMFLIIFMHEMGHKIASDKNNIKAAPPVLIPGPPPLGMLGAYVSIKDMMKTRNNMFDIALAGLTNGFICSCILLLIGLFLSVRLPTSDFLTLMANMTGSSQYDCAQTLAGRINNYNLLVLGLQKLFFPDPISQSYYYGKLLPDYIIALHPIAFAGWIGVVLTALNLVPLSFLDGGWIFHSIFPQKWGEIAGVVIGFIIFSTIDPFMRLFAIFSLSPALKDLTRTDVDPSDIAYPFKPLSKGRYILAISLVFFMILLYPLSGDALIYGFS